MNKLNLFRIKIDLGDILLEPISRFDAEEIFTGFDYSIGRYLYPSPPKDIGETFQFIDSAIRTMEQGSNIQLVIRDSRTYEFLGCVGLHNIDLDAPELGVWLKKSAQGQHIGRRAVQGLYSWACRNLPHKGFIYPVDIDNVPSRKIAESLDGVVVKQYREVTKDKRVLNVVEYFIPTI